MAKLQISISFIGNKIIHFCKVKISNFMCKQNKNYQSGQVFFFKTMELNNSKQICLGEETDFCHHYHYYYYIFIL